MSKFKRIPAYLLTTLFLTGMVFVSERTQQPAILFPEILALLTGMWIMQRMPWRVSRWAVPALMTLCACWGICISRYVDCPTAIQMGIAFTGAVCALLATRTTLLPILSACILPILIGERSWSYPLAVAVMTTLLSAIQLLLEQFGLRDRQPATRWDWSAQEERIRWAILIPAVIGTAAAAIALGRPCVVAPPLIVLLSELSFPDSPAATKGKRVGVVTVLCACLGAAARWGLVMQLSFPLWSAACIAAIGALTLFSLFHLPFPPAGALAVLPMLLPEAMIPTYPIQIAAGAALFLLIARFTRAVLQRKKGSTLDEKAHLSAR